jgi:hypothetical protein
VRKAITLAEPVSGWLRISSSFLRLSSTQLAALWLRVPQAARHNLPCWRRRSAGVAGIAASEAGPASLWGAAGLGPPGVPPHAGWRYWQAPLRACKCAATPRGRAGKGE